jgi:hypothetical protein
MNSRRHTLSGVAVKPSARSLGTAALVREISDAMRNKGGPLISAERLTSCSTTCRFEYTSAGTPKKSATPTKIMITRYVVRWVSTC